MKVVVGATYSTTHPDYPKVRVIARRACEVEQKTRRSSKDIDKMEIYEVYHERGFVCQVCDGKYHAPIFLDLDGCWRENDKFFNLDQQLSLPIERYSLEFFNLNK